MKTTLLSLFLASFAYAAKPSPPSYTIDSLLKEGFQPQPAEIDPAVSVNLTEATFHNLGLTCYLNAGMQGVFATKALMGRLSSNLTINPRRSGKSYAADGLFLFF
jgi:ubiquitin C-terminal hydrolase